MFLVSLNSNNVVRVIYLIFLFVVLGCSSELNQPNLSMPDSLFTRHPGFTEIDIPLDENRPLLLEDIARDISFIPLESQQEAFLKNTDDLLVGDSLILINTRRDIKYFSRSGDYLSTFQKSGRGPAEYMTIFGLAVDFAGNKMAIADQGFVKLYDIKGHFIKILKLPGPPFSLTPNITFLDSKHLLLENDRMKPYYEEGYSPLWSINIDNNEYEPLFRNYPDSVYRFRKKYSFFGYFMQAGNSVHYKSVDSYNVYAIDNSRNVSLRYRLNFGDRTMPLGALYDTQNFFEYRERFARIYTILEAERYRFIKYAINRVEGYAVYDKSAHTVIAHQPKAEGFASIQYPTLTFWPASVDDQGRLICVHPARNFVNGEILKGIATGDNVVLSMIVLK